MIKAVMLCSKYTTKNPLSNLKRNRLISQWKINFYKKSSLIEGVCTGIRGVLVELSDFPLLLSIKIKLLYKLGSIYGFDVNYYKERTYIRKLI